MVKISFTLNPYCKRFVNLLHGMHGRVTISRPAFALLSLALALSACGRKAADQQDLASLDAELTGNAGGNVRDPALTAALADQIMVDPALAQSSNDNVVRPPTRPDTGAVPPDGVAPRTDPTDPATLKRAPAATADLSLIHI